MSKDAALFRRLRLRLTLVCTVATGVILTAMALSALWVSQTQLTGRNAAAFQSEVNAVLYHLRSQSVVDQTWLAQMEAGGDLIIDVQLSGNALLYGSGEERQTLTEMARKKALQDFGFDLTEAPASRYQPEQTSFIYRDELGRSWRAAAVRLPQDKGWIGLLILRAMGEEQRELDVQKLAFALFVVAALCLLTLFSWVFTHRAMRPIEKSRQQQTAFIAAASHELRAPLAVVRNCLTATRSTDAEKAKRFTDMAVGECDRMSRLIGDMLTLANADSGAWTMHPAPTEPETLLLEATERFERVAHEKGLHLSALLPEAPLPRCSWDGERVLQLLTILLDNAISYTPVGGTVRLTASLAGERVCLAVADTGPGVPDEEKERVFDRFYRADTARTGRTHYGLGLCIAKEIAELHRGAVSVTDNPGGGAVFAAKLPIK